MGITLGGFDSSHPKFDSGKYFRQGRSVIKWKNSGGKGTIVAATGFGKSTLPIMAYNKIKKKQTVFKMVVVVPTTKLKSQWEKNLKRGGIDNFTVYVINTVSLNPNFRAVADLLVLDECHLFPATEFRNVFKNISYRFLMCLTATLNRSDGEQKLILKHAPICDTITQREAIERGWITDFIEFNLAVPVTQREAMQQTELNKAVSTYMRRFGSFDTMKDCMNIENARRYIRDRHGSTYKPMPDELRSVCRDAVQGMACIRKRKNFLDNTEHKIEAAAELIREFQVKTIVFSQSADFATSLAEELGKDISRAYHTKLPSEVIMEAKTKQYKTSKGASKFMQTLRDKGYEPKINLKTYLVSWLQPKKISGKKVAERNIALFEANKINSLITAKALNQGYDEDDVMLGVGGSRTSNPGDYVQISGRIARNFFYPDGKKAIKVFVNLYVPNWSIPNSSDERKLKLYQADAENVVWVDDLDELKENLKLLIKQRTSDK